MHISTILRKGTGEKMTKTKLLNAMVKQVCAKEKGKKQLNAGQAREVVKVIATLMQTNTEFYSMLFSYLNFLSEKKAKKK
jgi:hypothetical protein